MAFPLGKVLQVLVALYKAFLSGRTVTVGGVSVPLPDQGHTIPAGGGAGGLGTPHTPGSRQLGLLLDPASGYPADGEEPLALHVRPSVGQVLLAAICAAGCVVSFALGHTATQWAWWLALFLVLELSAAVSRQPDDTLSEKVWSWFGIRPARPAALLRVPILGLFMLELGAHFVTGGAYPWTGGLAVVATGAPAGAVIVLSLFEWRL